MPSYKSFSDKLLRECITDCDALISQLQKKIDTQNLLRTAYYQELDRRQLETYWQAHPELKINTDDEILITQKYQDYYVKSSGQIPITKLGQVCHIGEIHMKGDEVDYVSIKERGGITPLIVILEMRRAWLEQQKES